MNKRTYRRFYGSKIKTGYHALAIRILQKEKKPMTVKEIFDKMSKLKKITGKTPERTMSSILQRSSFVERVARGKYVLKNEYLNLDFDEILNRYTIR